MSNIYWVDGHYIEKENFSLSPLTHTFHYGLGVFEGVRSYKSSSGEINIFRLKDHTERLYESAKIVGIEIDYSFQEMLEAQKEVVEATLKKQAKVLHQFRSLKNALYPAPVVSSSAASSNQQQLSQH